MTSIRGIPEARKCNRILTVEASHARSAPFCGWRCWAAPRGGPADSLLPARVRPSRCGIAAGRPPPGLARGGGAAGRGWGVRVGVYVRASLSSSSTTTASRKGTATSTTVAHRHGARFARGLRRSALACGHWAHIWAAGARAWGGRWRSGNAALCSRRARRGCDGALDPLSIAPAVPTQAPTLAFLWIIFAASVSK